MMQTTAGSPEHHSRAEHLERLCLSEMYENAPAEVRRAMGWHCEPLDGAVVSIASQVPSILVNRVLGLGSSTPATAETIGTIRSLYRKAGVTRYFVHVTTDAEPRNLPDLLAGQGLVPQRRWMKFIHDARPAPDPATPLRVAPIEPEQALAFGRIVAGGFDLGEAAAGLFAPLLGRRGWHLLGAFEGGELAGAAGLFVQDDAAYLPFAATAPAHRRKGAQRALLARRIEIARELGCTLLFTETGEAVPGDPQHSYHNIEWSGFAPYYLRDNYAPEAD